MSFSDTRNSTLSSHLHVCGVSGVSGVTKKSELTTASMDKPVNTDKKSGSCPKSDLKPDLIPNQAKDLAYLDPNHDPEIGNLIYQYPNLESLKTGGLALAGDPDPNLTTGDPIHTLQVVEDTLRGAKDHTASSLIDIIALISDLTLAMIVVGEVG